jgi:copper homeostasis protein (lipoprotein)
MLPRRSIAPRAVAHLCLVLAASVAPGLSAAQSREPAEAGFIGAHGAKLPASFVGVLPCDDCDGIRHHLDLWPDQVFHLSRERLGGEAEASPDAVGRWHADPARRAIVLEGLPGGALPLRVSGPETLRPFDGEGPEAGTSADHALHALGTLDPVDLSLPLTGAFVHFADSALLTECSTGRRYPVAQEADYLALEQAYLAAGLAPQAPLLATLDATITERDSMEGPPRRTAVVDRLDGVWPGSSCADARAAPALMGTYWRILSLGDTAVAPEPGGREPHIVLFEDGGAPRFAATAGCNTLIGGVELDGEQLAFSGIAGTLMACPPPLDGLETALRETLLATEGFRRGGRHMRLRRADGEVLAMLEAVYASGLGLEPSSQP